MNEVKKCPECGGELEKGFVHVPRGLFWDTKEHKYGIGSSERLLSSWSWTMPRASGLICKNCRLVLFHY
ncbi:MAG: PF20097 family protein [Candidatus Freyarchaeum deiterrae]